MTLGLEALSNEIFGKNHLCSSVIMITNLREKFDFGEESKNKTLIDFWWPSKFSWNKLAFLSKRLPCFSLPYTIFYDPLRKVLNFIHLKSIFCTKADSFLCSSPSSIWTYGGDQWVGSRNLSECLENTWEFVPEVGNF